MEIGKKYSYANGVIFTPEVTLSNGDIAGIVTSHGTSWTIACPKNQLGWTEVVEPKKGTVYVAIMKRHSGDEFYSWSSVDKSSMKQNEQHDLCIASVEVPWTEGDKIDW